MRRKSAVGRNKALWTQLRHHLLSSEKKPGASHLHRATWDIMQIQTPWSFNLANEGTADGLNSFLTRKVSFEQESNIGVLERGSNSWASIDLIRVPRHTCKVFQATPNPGPVLQSIAKNDVACNCNALIAVRKIHGILIA